MRHGGSCAERVMKSFAVGILACLALGGTAGAADIPNMVGTWKPTGESAGARMGYSHAGWAAALEPVFNPTPRPLLWSKNRMGADYQVMRFYQTAVRTRSLASSNVMASRLSSAPN